MTKTISAAANPALANNLINSALAEAPVQQEVKITPPSDTVVTLPGGYLTATGEIITEAEVRELNGSDEEAIARTANIGKAILTILHRGTGIHNNAGRELRQETDPSFHSIKSRR